MKHFSRCTTVPVLVSLAFLLAHNLSDASAREITVHGNVVGEKGKPIESANVVFRVVHRRNRTSSHADRLLSTHSVQSKKDGVFTVRNIKLPDEVDLRLYWDIIADGYVDQQQTTRLQQENKGKKVTLKLKRGKLLSFQVVDPSEKPVVGAKVQVACKEPSFFCRPRVTGPKGRLQLWLPRETQHVVAIVHSANLATEERTILVDPSELNKIRLRKGPNVVGQLVDERGRDMAGYWIVAESTRPGYPFPAKVITKTKADGSFDLGQLRGEFNIRSPRWFRSWITEVHIQSTLPSVAVFSKTIQAGSEVEQVQVSLKAVRPATISGRITDFQNNPIVGRLIAINSLGSTGKDNIVLDYAITDKNGRYESNSIPRGAENIVVSPVGIRRLQGNIFLKPKTPDYVKSATPGGEMVRYSKLTDNVDRVDFQYRPWTVRDGFLDPVPDDLLTKPPSEVPQK